MRRGSFVRGRFMTARVLRAAAEKSVGGDDTIRAAAVVSKKVAKTAVVRNRARRALYSAVASIGTPTPLRIVFVVNTLPNEAYERAFAADAASIISALT